MMNNTIFIIHEIFSGAICVHRAFLIRRRRENVAGRIPNSVKGDCRVQTETARKDQADGGQVSSLLFIYKSQ